LAEVGFLVVGTPRSGTTFVQRLACEVPGVAMPAETHFFSEFLPGLLARRSFPLAGAELADELARFCARDNARGLGLEPGQVTAVLGGQARSPAELFCALVSALAGPAELLGEKTPDHLLWWPLIDSLMPEVRFVAVVRDPRAVVASALATPWGEGGWAASSRLPDHLSLAARWAVQQDHLAGLQAKVGPQRCLVVRYEDAVADPQGTRRALARFLGRAEPTGAQAAPAHIVLGWETWKGNALGPSDPARVRAWRHGLGGRLAGEVAAACADQMRRFGYRPPRLGALGQAHRLARRAVSRRPQPSAKIRLGPETYWRLVGFCEEYRAWLDQLNRRAVETAVASERTRAWAREGVNRSR
jgi:hypothetical protein